jgi:hypothetical protein
MVRSLSRAQLVLAMLVAAAVVTVACGPEGDADDYASSGPRRQGDVFDAGVVAGP